MNISSFLKVAANHIIWELLILVKLLNKVFSSLKQPWQYITLHSLCLKFINEETSILKQGVSIVLQSTVVSLGNLSAAVLTMSSDALNTASTFVLLLLFELFKSSHLLLFHFLNFFLFIFVKLSMQGLLTFHFCKFFLF